APNQDPDGDGAALVLDMRFPGQRFDAASGLNQNYFRDYDSATGRYGQSDPIGLHGGIGTYVYSLSSPFRWSDKFGLLPGDCYRTENLAAAQALKDILPASIREDLEYGGWVYQKP
ncbi:RHS repeat-associated core domain-containing protein, partial [Xanthomonas hortorum]